MQSRTSSKVIANTTQPTRFSTLIGKFHTYIQSIELENNCINICIIKNDDSPTLNRNPNKKLKLVFSDREIIAVFPALLGGKLSCFDALKELEPFLRKKHKTHLDAYRPSSLWYDPLRATRLETRLFALQDVLLGKEDFADLCLYFPHEESEKYKTIYNVPIKVVDDEIIEAITANFPAVFETNKPCYS